MEPDPRQVTSAVAEIARRRDMTHIVLSDESYQLYLSRLTKACRKQGILPSRAHHASILVVPGVANHLVLSFSVKSRSQGVASLLAAYRAEDWEEARSIMIKLCRRTSRYIAVSRLPLADSEE